MAKFYRREINVSRCWYSKQLTQRVDSSIRPRMKEMRHQGLGENGLDQCRIRVFVFYMQM